VRDMGKIAEITKHYWYYPAGAAIGGAGGFTYWYYVGCASGTCPITSSPIFSTIWGLLIGSLLFTSIFSK